MNPRMALRAIKVVHTAIWAFFVLAILAIWLFALRENWAGAGWAIAIVLVEVAVLAFNRWHCPLGRFAANYTTERRANFDIYLPAWLAAHNKAIFGTLFGGGVLFTAMRWAMQVPDL